MTQSQHTLAMLHYDNCMMDAIDEDIHDSMKNMKPLYDAAPDLLDLLHVILMQHRTDGAYSSKGEVSLSPAMERNIEALINKARGQA